MANKLINNDVFELNIRETAYSDVLPRVIFKFNSLVIYVRIVKKSRVSV